MSYDKHSYFMSLALEESKKALPNCLPNPPVGCVLVKEGVVVSSGFTQVPGSEHAEANALAKLTGSLEGVSAYITLEPCSFHGRTPSCAQALVKRNIGQVYIGITDPDPRNNGKGTAMLKKAGIPVTEGIMSRAVLEYLTPYLAKSMVV